MSYDGSSDSSSSGSYGGDSSGGYGGSDTSDSGMSSDTSSSGYGGDTSTSGMSGDDSTSSTDSNASSYGGIAGAGADYSGANNSSNEQGSVTGADVSSSTSDSDSTTGNYGGIAGADHSSAVQNSDEDTTGAVADNSLSATDNPDDNSYSGFGVQGGELCSYESLGLGNYSLADNNPGTYNHDESVQAYEQTLDKIQETWDTTKSWFSDKIAQPLSNIYDSYVAPTINNVEVTASDTFNNYVTQPINDAETALSNTYNENIEPTINNVETAISSTYDNYVTQPLNNLESTLSTTYDEGVKTAENYIESDKVLDNIVNHPENIQKGEVTLGALQTVGGFTEATTGYTIATGGTVASGGLATAPSIVGGGYLAIDGASNFRGGLSRMENGLEGTMAGDTENFMKNSYIAYGPDKDKIYSGENIYNATQIGIGAYTITKGISALPNDAVKVDRSWLGYQSVANDAETYTDISLTMKAVDVSTWTNSGLRVNSININIPQIISGVSLIGIDVNNANESKKSIK